MQNSVTYRRRPPEGTTFVTIRYGEDLHPDLVIVNIGKAGSWLNAAADMAARLSGAAFRAGAEPLDVAAIIAGISHDRSPGNGDTKSLADAIARSFVEFAEEVENVQHP